MLINISELLSRDKDTKVYTAQMDFDTFESQMGSYEVVSKSPIKLTITNLGERKLLITGDVALSLNIPCDRCLEPVRSDISFSIEKSLDMSNSDSDGIEKEDQDYMDGYNLDVDKLVYGDIYMNIPAKTLCKEDCKGLCLKCGANLNDAECGCNRESLDPRMSVIQDIFNQFKEV